MTDERPPTSEEMIRRAREELESPIDPPEAAESDPTDDPPLPRPADGLGDPGPGRRPGRIEAAGDGRGRLPTVVAVIFGLAVASVVSFALTRGDGDGGDSAIIDGVESGIVDGMEQMGLDDETASCVLGSLRASGAYDELGELSDADIVTLATISPTAPLSDYPAEFRPVADALVTAMTSCIDPDDVPGLRPTDGAAATLGDDPDLDRLWRACEADGSEACDLLYLVSPVGTEYETFGATCGGRDGPDDGLCMDLHGDGIRLDAWRSACATGDNGACDLLYQLSPLGSEDEAFGTSCGGRDEPSPLPCWARLGPGSG